jgi:hypothetical protein
MKTCSTCGEVKELECFQKRTEAKDGLDYKCKDCEAKRKRKKREEARIEREANKPPSVIPTERACLRCHVIKPLTSFGLHKIGKYGRRGECLDCRRAAEALKKATDEAFRLKEQERLARLYEADKEAWKQRTRQYAEDHPEARKEQYRHRRETEPQYRLRMLISSTINSGLKRRGSSKNGVSCMDYLGYTIGELAAHLEALFEPWMTWDNWGVYNPSTWIDNEPTTWKWQIDHIISHADFQYSTMEDEEFRSCWALTNLRPYSAKQNVLDGRRKQQPTKGTEQ